MKILIFILNILIILNSSYIFTFPVNETFLKLEKAIKEHSSVLDILNSINNTNNIINIVDIVDDYGDTLLHIAAENDNIEAIKLLVNKGINIDVINNNTYRTPLHVAAKNNKVKAIDCLISLGANKESQEVFLYTPLHMAILSNKKEAISILLEKNANVDAIAKSFSTPLYLAILFEEQKIAELLLDKGANIDLIDDEGDTLLHWAVSSISCANANIKELKSIIKMLIKLGANLNKKNFKNQTPLDIEKERMKKIKAEYADIYDILNYPVFYDKDTYRTYRDNIQALFPSKLFQLPKLQ